MTEQPATTNSDSAPCGPPQLAELRAKKGLSLDEMAQRLRITPVQAAALENLQFAQLPRPPYLQGFVRNYCRVLDTDPSPFIEMANASVNRAKPAVRDDPRELGRFDDTMGLTPLHTRRMWRGAVAVVLMTGIALAVIERDAWLPAVTGRLAQVPTPPATQAGAPPIAQAPASSSSGASDAPAQESVTLAPSPALASGAVSTPGPQISAEGKRLVRLVFRGDSWVEVREASGAALTSQLNKAGSEQSLAGTPPLKVTIGAARDVSLEVDGKPFELTPFVRDDVARLTLE
jgi:cytoskeleton protein RodZ